MKTKKPQKKESKRFVHWLSAPGNVCLPYAESAFTDSPNWRIFRIMAEFVEGFEFLVPLVQEVSIFGSARTQEDHPSYQDARTLGKLLGQNGFTVLTGGGPGIMEAANRGAVEGGGESVGLNIQLPREQRTNSYVKRSIGFHYFFTRKVMLSASAQAYVFYPGGFGTMDEMTEMITLIQTGKMPDNVPVILVGKDYWGPWLEWVKSAMMMDGHYIEPEELAIIQLVNSAEEAFNIIKETHERPYG